MMTDKQDNLLAVLLAAGVGSRRQLAAAIIDGRVLVNGAVATNLRQAVDRERDSITIDGKPVALKAEEMVYLLLNKPEDVLSTVRDDRGRKMVLDIIPPQYRHLRLYPAGRLDRDTTGLLLLTNDGALTHRLTHPGFAVEKEYLARIDGRLTPAEIKRLERGIRLDDGVTAPAVVKEAESEPPFSYWLTIHEGRKRQLRRMLAALGYATRSLKRVRMGRLELGDLKEGECRELSRDDIEMMVGRK